MPTGATGQLGLALPVQGELSGTWGNTVNNAITEYTNIAIAATLTLTGDGAVNLQNTTGTDLVTNITSSLTGAGTVTAQFAIVRVTGTLTTAKVVTAPSYSKTYTVVNAATGGIVTFKASGQTGVSIAVGESAFVYFNGTDYVKLAGTATAGAAAGSNTQVQYNSSGSLAGSANLTFSGTTLTLQNGYYEAYDPVDTTSAGVGMRFYTNGGGTKTENGRLVVSQTGAGSALSSMIFQTNSGSSLAEQMRLTSTGLGIGTSTFTSGSKLSVQTTAGKFEVIAEGGSSVKLKNGGALTIESADAFYFNSGASEIMRLTASGNLGLGVTPSASTTPQFQIGRLVLNDLANFTAIGNNATYNSGYKYIGNSAASVYQQNAGIHYWFNAPSGTAGNAITFTQAMTLTAAGNLAIGTTSSGTKLFLASDDSTTIGQLRLGRSADPSFFWEIGRENLATGAFVFSNASGGVTAERARISAAGGFSVGTTSDPGAGAIYATGNITAYYSDARLKTVSGKIENALDKVGKLSGVYYTNNDTAKSFGYDSDEVQVGVLAQDVESVMPEIVKATS